MFVDTIKRLSLLSDEKEEDAESLNSAEVAASGWEKFPKLCLQLLLENPYVFDLMKYDVVKWEFNLSEFKKRHHEDRHMGALAALVGHVVRSGQMNAAKKKPPTDEKTWFAGYMGEHDYRSLKEARPEYKKNWIGMPKYPSREVKEKEGKLSKTPVNEPQNGVQSEAQNEGGLDSSIDENQYDGGSQEDAAKKKSMQEHNVK